MNRVCPCSPQSRRVSSLYYVYVYVIRKQHLFLHKTLSSICIVYVLYKRIKRIKRGQDACYGLRSGAADSRKVGIGDNLLERIDKRVERAKTIVVLGTSPQAPEGHDAVVENEPDMLLVGTRHDLELQVGREWADPTRWTGISNGFWEAVDQERGGDLL